MGRRRKSGLDEVASSPWPVGIVAGILAFLLIRYGVGTWFSAAGSSLLGPLGQQIGGTLAPLAWFAMLACWIAAGVSWLRAKQRRRLHDTRSDLDSLADISWREFEMLVGESFRRQGYEVAETGLGGKDGGIDLIVSKSGRRELVQCKQWKRRQVGAATVREMWGLVDHHGAAAVHIVSLGDFTPDAARFAEGKLIHLVTGRDLLERIRAAQAGGRPAPTQAAPASDTPSCPVCAGAMALRHNRHTRQPFWGCTRFPQCKGTTAVSF
ncbi:restriction endonuclease [Novilysobacter spongiicola]|uniref:Restriction system protein n=1 Tax=Lysobacter spongiicola DSM 21749 TaxID=1122188 RepID=A0A1T4R782_9GAMM|nr:restriction endonuclease [Lysobacter spongiicola]SKA11795.1 restriction system protein [Lysobacter spongiicola DSM 21749]